MNIEVKHNFNAKNITSFKVSGEIENAYFPKDIDELIYLLKTLEQPLVLGNCSNVLISSDGYQGNVIFTSGCNKYEFNGNNLYAECGVKGPMISQAASENGLSGFEFMIGFPGSIGGEIYMNASAQSQAISDCLISAAIFDRQQNEILELSKEDLQFEYRKSACQDKKYVVLSAKFKLISESESKIQRQMVKNLEFRRSHQPPLSLPNCGSVFKNTENISAGRLLDDVGAKNFSFGGAKVWENHANFIINKSNATSEDILNLMLLMYNKVKEVHNLELVPEVIYVGNNSENEERIWKLLTQK